MNKIYLVCGTCGSYDDVEVWNVIAYASKVKAANHARKAMQTAANIPPGKDGINKYDPDRFASYGTKYYVEEINIIT